MAKGFLGLEVTSARIRFVYLVKHGRFFEIQKAGSLPYKVDQNLRGSLAEEIHQLLEREDLHPRQIFLTVSRQDTLLREVVIPRLHAHELDEVVTGEIEKIPSFANKRFDYILQKYPSTPGKLKLVYAAIEQSLLDYLFLETKKIEVPFNHFEIAPLNLKEFVYLLKPTAKNHAMLVVNDFVSYFLIFRDHQYRFLYKTNTGLENLYSHAGGKVSPPVLANFIAEIERVMKSYYLEHKSDPIEQLWLVHDHTFAPDLEKSLKELLGLPVESLSPQKLPQIKFGPQVTDPNPIYLLALIPVIYETHRLTPQFAFNHFFRGLQASRQAMKAVLVALIFFGAVAYGLGHMAFMYSRSSQQLRQKTQELSLQTEQLRGEFADLFRQRDEYMAVREGLLAQATYVQLLNRISWSEVLSVVAEDMPAQLSLTQFRFSEDGNVNFEGESMRVETVAELLRRVDYSQFLKNGKFDFLREAMVQEQKIFAYGIFSSLKTKTQAEEKGAKSEPAKTNPENSSTAQVDVGAPGSQAAQSTPARTIDGK